MQEIDIMNILTFTVNKLTDLEEMCLEQWNDPGNEGRLSVL
jgi:hypothetical protein